MYWLQSLDTALFHWINSALANPFFDWLMPRLSGNGVPWLLGVALGVPVVMILGSVRLRLCVLIMVLVVALGDPLVIGTIKEVVARPRPFVTLPDARHFGQTGQGYVQPLTDGTLPPSANRHSFPSAHAANSFAVAMVGFLFYRRSARVLFPLAAAISTDGCKTWSPPRTLANMPGFQSAYPSATQAADGTLIAVWFQILPNKARELRLARFNREWLEAD